MALDLELVVGLTCAHTIMIIIAHTGKEFTVVCLQYSTLVKLLRLT